jgi:Lrp/AsnC family transcriptional regulator
MHFHKSIKINALGLGLYFYHFYVVSGFKKIYAEVGFSGEIFMDATDRKILQIVQTDSSLSIAAIAAQVGLSQTPCWKRIQKLEAEGIIRRRIALLDPAKLGLGITVFVTIEVGEHAHDKLDHFAATISAMGEVLDIYRMAGDVDYLLKVVVADTKSFDAFYKKLIEALPLKKVTSRFALESIKAETALPIHV